MSNSIGSVLALALVAGLCVGFLIGWMVGMYFGYRSALKVQPILKRMAMILHTVSRYLRGSSMETSGKHIDMADEVDKVREVLEHVMVPPKEREQHV